jgi:circadian clock protein KaiC
MDRVKTGIEGLDQLLCGGFLRGDALLVAGAPGSGKTSLGMHYLHNGATQYDEPGLFITFEEFPERIYRDADNFGWDFRALEAQGKLKVLFTSPEVLQQDIIRDQGIVSEMISEIGATRAVVDSISHLQTAEEDPRRLRESVYGLVNALKREGLTALLTHELRDQEDIGASPEEFVADGLILLTRSYVGGHHMRFIEVLKSRGSPHIAMPSLFFLAEGGMRVMPPFQQPFYRFEEAVSTGIPRLDDLLGGGIPYGGFYLMEIDAELHQDIFDAGLAKEALEAGDRYIRVAGPSDENSRWYSLMKAAGMEQPLLQAVESGQVTFVAQDGACALPQGTAPDAFVSEWSRLARGDEATPTRIQVDVSRLFTLLPPDQAYAALLGVTRSCQQAKTVMVGVASPRAIPREHLEKLRACADGIVKVWTEGGYPYLQVVKTVNSVRTPVYAINPVPEPPFVEIMTE